MTEPNIIEIEALLVDTRNEDDLCDFCVHNLQGDMGGPCADCSNNGEFENEDWNSNQLPYTAVIRTLLDALQQAEKGAELLRQGFNNALNQRDKMEDALAEAQGRIGELEHEIHAYEGCCIESSVTCENFNGAALRGEE